MNYKQPTSAAVKTAEEILNDELTLHQQKIFEKEVNLKEFVIDAMKIYANAKLDEAADISDHERLHYIWKESSSDNIQDIMYCKGKGVAFKECNESILSLKDKI